MFFVFSKKKIAKGPVCECDQLELETSNAILLQPLFQLPSNALHWLYSMLCIVPSKHMVSKIHCIPSNSATYPHLQGSLHS